MAITPTLSSVRDKENTRHAHEGAMRVAERQGRIYENRQREYNRIADHVDRMWYAANTKETPMYRIQTLNENRWLHTTAYTPPYTASDETKALARRYSQNQGYVETLEEARAMTQVVMGLTKSPGCIRITDQDGNVCT